MISSVLSFSPLEVGNGGRYDCICYNDLARKITVSSRMILVSLLCKLEGERGEGWREGNTKREKETILSKLLLRVKWT